MQKWVKYILRLASIYFFLTYFMLYVGTMPFSPTENMLRNSNDNHFIIAIGIILTACLFFVLSGVVSKLIVNDQRDALISTPDHFNRNVVEIGVILLGLNFFIQGFASTFNSSLYSVAIPMMMASSDLKAIGSLLLLPILKMVFGCILLFSAKKFGGILCKN